MNDFFNDQPEINTEEVNTEQVEVEKIKVGEKEYTQEELNQLVGAGERTREIESKFNTKIDRVYPEYTKTTQELKAAKEELERLRATQQTQGGTLTDDQKAEAIKALKELGVVLKDDKPMTREEFRQAYLEERQTDQLIEEVSSLEKSMDGKDGRPRFDKVEILEHMRETGIKNPEKAYKDKFEKELDEWKVKNMSTKNDGMYTMERKGGMQNPAPTDVRPTKDNIDKLVSEALAGKI